jgi:protein SSD1
VNEIVTGGQLKQCLRDVIKYQTVKLLENFDYFQGLNSDPATWVHYAINLPLYTHCATPTRNYADLLVQRQLVAAIDGLPWTVPETETTALLENCTRGKQIAQHIQNSC